MPWSPDILLQIPQLKSALVPEALSTQKPAIQFRPASHATPPHSFCHNVNRLLSREDSPTHAHLLPSQSLRWCSTWTFLEMQHLRPQKTELDVLERGPGICMSMSHKRSFRREYQEVPAITHKLLAAVKERVCHLVDTGGLCLRSHYGCESRTVKKAESWVKN